MSPRINFFQQLKNFYASVWHGSNDFTPHHVSLYFFLVNQNNRNSWAEWFKVPFDLGMKGSCIGTKRTYYSTLEDLEKWGYILYHRGVNEWKTPEISIIPLCNKAPEIPSFDEVEVSFSTTSVTATAPQVLPLPIPLPIPLLSPQPHRDIDLKTNTRHKDLETDFLLFWSEYPKKVSKPTALRAFEKAIKKTNLQKILDSLKIFKASEGWTKEQGRYIPNPATWLNGERWDDEISGSPQTTEQPKWTISKFKPMDYLDD